MGLSCTCGEWDGDGWYYLFSEPKGDKAFDILKTNRAKRCCSCKSLIAVGDNCLEFPRYQSTAEGSVNESIYGDEMPLASYWMCETCGEQYLNLDALGYCIDITENMLELLAEYREEHGIKLAA